MYNKITKNNLNVMDFILIKQDSTEWDYMWNWLEEHPINKGLDEPKTALNNGFEWEYMGSYMEGKKILHEFKHRQHPLTQELVKTSVSASKDFTTEQIAKSFKIKT